MISLPMKSLTKTQNMCKMPPSIASVRRSSEDASTRSACDLLFADCHVGDCSRRAACPRPGPGPRCQTRGTLSSIGGRATAQRPRRVARANGLRNQNLIYVGQRLTIPRWRGRTYHGGKRHVHCPGRGFVVRHRAPLRHHRGCAQEGQWADRFCDLCRAAAHHPRGGSSTKVGEAARPAGGTGQASGGDRCTSFAGGTRWHQSPTATALPPRQLPKPMAWQNRITSILARSCASPKGVVLRRRQHLHRVVPSALSSISQRQRIVRLPG